MQIKPLWEANKALSFGEHFANGMILVRPVESRKPNLIECVTSVDGKTAWRQNDGPNGSQIVSDLDWFYYVSKQGKNNKIFARSFLTGEPKIVCDLGPANGQIVGFLDGGIVFCSPIEK